MKYTKIDEHTIEATEEITTTRTFSYQYDDVIAQKVSLVKQRDEEIAALDEILAKFKELG